MKQFLAITGLFFLISNIYAAKEVKEVAVKIRLQQAKDIYNLMVDSGVQTEGTAGHSYVNGKSILCRYTDADMDDPQGHSIPQEDPRRYICSMQFNQNGLASPGDI